MGHMVMSSTGGCVDLRDTRAQRQDLTLVRSFARLSRFADNANHAPAGHEGAQTSDDVMAFLQKVAGGKAR